MDDPLLVGLGAFFVAIYAASRFNIPPTNRSSTTAARYHIAATLYVSAMLFLFALLALLSPPALQAMGGSAAEAVPGPFLAALFLTSLLPSVPWIKRADALLRRWFSQMAAIPHEARRLSAELREASLDLDSRRKKSVLEEITERGLDPLVREPPREDLSRDWLRVTVLETAIRDWERDRRLNAYLSEFDQDAKQLRQRYEALSQEMATAVQIASPPGGKDEKHRETVSKDEDEENQKTNLLDAHLRSLTKQVERLHRNYCDFVSRGILRSRGTRAARIAEIRRLGLVAEVRAHGPTVHELAGLGIALAIIVSSVLLAPTEWAPPPENVPRLFFLITFSPLMAVLAVVFFQRCTPSFCMRDTRGGRPWLTYLAMGLLGAVLMTGLAAIVSGLAVHDATGVAKEVFEGLPWRLIPFVLAFTLGFHLDDRTERTRRQSIWEAASSACALVLASLLVTTVLLPAASESGAILWKQVGRAAFLSAMIGGLVGALVPRWFWRGDREIEDAEESFDHEVFYLPH